MGLHREGDRRVWREVGTRDRARRRNAVAPLCLACRPELFRSLIVGAGAATDTLSVEGTLKWMIEAEPLPPLIQKGRSRHRWTGRPRRRIDQSRQSHAEHGTDEKRGERRHRTSHGQRFDTGNGEPQQHDVSRHVRREDMAESEITHRVDDAGHGCEPNSTGVSRRPWRRRHRHGRRFSRAFHDPPFPMRWLPQPTTVCDRRIFVFVPAPRRDDDAKRSIALGMKSLANGVILKTGAVTAIECLQYALSLPTSVVITGIDSLECLEQAFLKLHGRSVRWTMHNAVRC